MSAAQVVRLLSSLGELVVLLMRHFGTDDPAEAIKKETAALKRVETAAKRAHAARRRKKR